MILQILGWIGTIAFMLFGIEMAYTAIKTKKSDLRMPTLTIWWVAELCYIISVIGVRADMFLIANYVVNFFCLGIVSYYALPRSLTGRQITDIKQLKPEELEFELNKLMVEIEKTMGTSVDTQKRIIGGRNDN